MPVHQKAKKVKRAGLIPNAKGEYVIKNEAEGLLALRKAIEVQAEMAQIAIDNDLPGKNADYEALRAALKEYQDKNEILEITDGVNKSLLVERTESKWIFKDEDIPENWEGEEGEEVKSLTAIFKELFPDEKKFKRMINKITSRILDKDKLDEVVKSGAVSAEQVEPAFLNYVKTTYVKIGGK